MFLLQRVPIIRCAHVTDSSPTSCVVTFQVDGSNTAYAPKRLFEESGSDSLIPTTAFAKRSGQDKGATGIYGPADGDTPTAVQQEPKAALTWDYCIKAHVTCDESDDGADR